MDAIVNTRRLYLIRHGETAWNAIQRLQGRSDIPLNDNGRHQALRHGQLLRERIAKPEAWYFVSSLLARARETIEIIREALGLPRAGYDCSDQIKELSYGAWEGRSWTELRAEDPTLMARRFENPWETVAPDGESHDQMQARVLAWFHALPPLTVAVTHSGPTRIVRGYLRGLPNKETALQKSPQDSFLSIEADDFEWV